MYFQVFLLYCIFGLIQLADSNENSDPDINLKECGLLRTKTDPLPRIVGGIVIEIQESPWMVSLQKLRKKQFEHFCGGSIINRRWILTAAHCLQGVKHSGTKVRAVMGSTQSNGTDGQILETEKLLVHEEFDSYNYNNDIAMLKTESDIEFKTASKKFRINSVCLMLNNTKVPKTAQIYGWGLNAENGNRSNDLMKTSLDTYDYDKCNSFYEEYIGSLSEHMVCFWHKDQDACQGDSGGPLTKFIKGKEYQIGIISFGLGCGRADTPGIYTKVSDYIEWITSTIRDN